MLDNAVHRISCKGGEGGRNISAKEKHLSVYEVVGSLALSLQIIAVYSR